MPKTALITGASAGLGAEFARQLARQGTDLVLIARRVDKLDALAAELSLEHKVSVKTIAADLSGLKAPEMIQRTLEEAGVTVDYLINNAGAGGPDLLEDEGWPQQDEYLRLMMISVAEMCHRFIPGMRQRGFGRVINVASVAGRYIRGGDTNYGPSKSYLVALSESMHTLRAEGVHVSALCPGFTHTDFHADGRLAEMKSSLPKFIWYNADLVVREGLRAVEKGKVLCISGRMYRWLDLILQSKLLRPVLVRLA